MVDIINTPNKTFNSLTTIYIDQGEWSQELSLPDNILEELIVKLYNNRPELFESITGDLDKAEEILQLEEEVNRLNNQVESLREDISILEDNNV